MKTFNVGSKITRIDLYVGGSTVGVITRETKCFIWVKFPRGETTKLFKRVGDVMRNWDDKYIYKPFKFVKPRLNKKFRRVLLDWFNNPKLKQAFDYSRELNISYFDFKRLTRNFATGKKVVSNNEIFKYMVNKVYQADLLPRDLEKRTVEIFDRNTKIFSY